MLTTYRSGKNKKTRNIYSIEEENNDLRNHIPINNTGVLYVNAVERTFKN